MILMQYDKKKRFKKQTYLELGGVGTMIFYVWLCLRLHFFSFCLGLPRTFLPMVPRYVNATELKKRNFFAEQIIIQWNTHYSTKDHRITTGRGSMDGWVRLWSRKQRSPTDNWSIIHHRIYHRLLLLSSSSFEIFISPCHCDGMWFDSEVSRLISKIVKGSL